ncbi:hypothetical protein D3C85_1916340 [compost metagenome]
MHIGRRLLDATQRESLDRAIANCLHAVDELRLVETLRLQVVHQVIREIWRGVAACALRLAVE